MLAQAFGCGLNVQRLGRVESRGGPQRSCGGKIAAVTDSRYQELIRKKDLPDAVKKPIGKL
jgi:hypothetical protein